MADLTSLLHHYDAVKDDLRALDAVYLRVTLLYVAVSGALIASHKVWAQVEGLHPMVALLPIPACVCVLGVIYRVRALIDQNHKLLGRLEKRLGLESFRWPSGLASIRTSLFLFVLVILVTAMISGLILQATNLDQSQRLT